MARSPVVVQAILFTIIAVPRNVAGTRIVISVHMAFSAVPEREMYVANS